MAEETGVAQSTVQDIYGQNRPVVEERRTGKMEELLPLLRRVAGSTLSRSASFTLTPVWLPKGI